MPSDGLLTTLVVSVSEKPVVDRKKKSPRATEKSPRGEANDINKAQEQPDPASPLPTPPQRPGGDHSSSKKKREDAASKSPPPPLRLNVGEIKFEGSPKMSSTRSPAPVKGMSGVLPPVSLEHQKVNEQLIAQRRQRMEGPQDVIRSARKQTADDDEEEAYELFKRSLASVTSIHPPSSAHGHLPSLGIGAIQSRPQPPESAPPAFSFSTAGTASSKLAAPTAGGVLRNPSPKATNRNLTVEVTSIGSFSSPSKHRAVAQISSNSSSPFHRKDNGGFNSSFVRPSFLAHLRSAQPSAVPSPLPLLGTSGELTAQHSSVSVASPSTPIPRGKMDVPRIDTNFRVQDNDDDSAATSHPPSERGVYYQATPQTSQPATFRAAGSDVYLQAQYYTNANYYMGGSLGRSSGSPFAHDSIKSESLPYWALPPLPIGMSDPTPRVTTVVTPSADTTLDTARNDERTLAWRNARQAPNFRGRVVINTSAERSKVDPLMASVPWNERFQALLELPCVQPKDAVARAAAIDALQEEFRDAVLPIVETIILEREAVVKTIPLEPLGGVAGGDKYVFGNIVFKFATSHKMIELYGSHDHAVKSVANELKGLKGLVMSDVPLLHYPLGMMVCFLGHCVWAAAKIPIDETTLKSGSRDGGRTVVAADDPGASAISAAIASSLNLKRHRVGKDRTDVCGPVDLEIHCGLDGRYYALDTARLYPPDANSAVGSAHNFHLYRCLRRELVLNNPDPLSSDSFSPFGKDRKNEHDEEVLTASLSITNVKIPALVKDLDRLFRLVSVRDVEFSTAGILHERGINVRYIAVLLDCYLRHCTQSGIRPHQPAVTHLAVEIVSRAFAAVVREDLFSLRAQSNLSQYHALLVERFNQLLCGVGDDCVSVWRQRLPVAIAEKYNPPSVLRKGLESLIVRKSFQLANVSDEWFHRILFHRASALLGVHWNLDADRDHELFARLGTGCSSEIFTVPLIASVKAIVKMNDPNPQRVAHQLVREGRLGEAEQRFMAELRVRSSVLGETPALVPLLHSIAELYAMSLWGPGFPRMVDATSYSERAVRIFQRIHDSTDRMSRQNSNNAPVAADVNPDSPDAAPSGRSATPPPPISVDDLPNVFWEGYVGALANHGRLLRESRRLKDALDVISTALTIFSSHSIDNKQMSASLHSSQALTWRRMGRFVECYESAQAAVAVTEAMYLVNKNSYNAERLAEAQCLMAEAAHRVGFRKEAHRRSDEALALAGGFEVVPKSARGRSDSAAATLLRQILTPRHQEKLNGIHAEDGLGSRQDTGTSLGLSPRPDDSSLESTMSCCAASSLISWVSVRLDGVNIEEAREVPLSVLRDQLREARKSLVMAYGTKSLEVIHCLLVEAQLAKVEGRFSAGARLCEEGLTVAHVLYGPKSFVEHSILFTLAEFSFLPTVDQKIDASMNSDNPQSPRNPERLVIATSYVQQGLAILQLLKDESTTYFARGLTLLADITRISPAANSQTLSEAKQKVGQAVYIFENANLHNAPWYIYALNIQAYLRIELNPSAVVIPDLFRALASSDRFMIVADSDHFTQETIMYCQQRNKHAPGAKYKVILSRDGLMRKLAGQLQLAAMLLSHDELLEAASTAKGLFTLVRDLFPANAPWSDDCREVIPLLFSIAGELLRRTGNVLGPVTEIGQKIRSVAEELQAKEMAFSTHEKQRMQSEEEQAAAEEFRRRQERLTSQAKQVGTYFGTRHFPNGFALLHALLDGFQEMYPDGATPTIPHSITTHNAIVTQILFAKHCIEPPTTTTGALPHLAVPNAENLMNMLLIAEDRVVDVLREPVLIHSPSEFAGWSSESRDYGIDEPKRKSTSHARDSMSSYRFDSPPPEVSEKPEASR